MAGLFGKLPARRDYVARELPQAFLDTVEPWLQRSVAQGRETLGAAWLDAYLEAPIWRFYLATPVTGYGAFGALMPSVDGVGRYFPLLIAALGERDAPLAPPGEEAEPWFAATEDVLLSALSDNNDLDGVVAALRALPEAPVTANADDHRPFTRWWTLGGPHFPPQRVDWSGLPPATFFATLLTGDRAHCAAATEAHPER